jgi:Ca-activated chloride channel family protein
MTELHFLRPLWLLALVPIAALLIQLYRKRMRAGAWETVCDPALVPFVIQPGKGGASPIRLVWIGLGALLAVLALAGPAWKKIPQPVFSDRNALVIALDLSLSMDATDVTPSRLGRAMFELQDILLARDAGRGETGLLVYAGDAFAVAPLTDDTDTVANLLKAMTSDLMPSRGSHTIRALELAEQLLAETRAGNGHILLVTDSIEFQADRTVRELRRKGIRTSVLAMGTPEGSPIPTGKGFVTTRGGEIVIPAVDLAKLGRIASDGGGLLIRGQPGDSEIQTLVDWLESHVADSEAEGKELQADLWEEEGPWLLIILLPLAALAFRRGILAVLLVALCLPFPQARAEPDSLWSTPDQQAARLLEQGDIAKAAEMFQSPDWQAVARYQNGQYDEAAAALEGRDDGLSLYNRGNALARKGDFQAAIDAYTRALEVDPGNQDARFNKELLEELERQEQNSSQDGENSQGQGEPGQEGGQAQDQGSQQDSSSDQSGEQQGEPQSSESNQAEQQQAQQDGQQGEQSMQQAMSQGQKDESAQATEQWLRRIPDDPGGLLRRKFYYQYQQRPRETVNEEEEFW